jgi:hypothetical protein
VAANWLEDPAVRLAAGVNRWEGTDWLVREQWEALVDLRALLAAASFVGRSPTAAAAIRLAADLKAAASDAGYRLDRLVDTPSARRA